MIVDSLVLPKATYNLVKRLTGQSRPDLALSLALKDLIRLRIKEAESHIAVFEKKYAMTFREFESAWKNGKIDDPYSYPVEQDYFEWEAFVSELEGLQEISQWMA
jgi:hypothetical protein